ncbi:peroxidase-related enzyme [Agrobacterium sp. rho-13.3]|uniref:peroxidase-related enzyme n=1 Tax=Agrobacterium sp. rho-13.3 TaxID=3072980 RepID=UPI002A0EE740|nr:peroxidase-related enzyme [Agrobacterium sp. rho-13.3]MDX8309120.1 peroxidase-related enzyme [Agrobacterium sp. rho-13.3]
MSRAVHEFTLDALIWQPYVKPIDLDQATPAQRTALNVTPSNTKVSAYMLMLANDAEILTERTPLFNDIMYSEGGLSRGGREIGALAASFVNKCIYCAAVHANRYIQLEKRPDVVDEIYENGLDADLPDLEQALFNFGVNLTAHPDNVGVYQFYHLRENGLDDLEILDLIHSVSIFGWANRLMHTLGEPHRKD